MKAVEELKKEQCNARFHQLDINDKNSVADLKNYLQTTYGGIDILINNAAIAYKVSVQCGVVLQVIMECCELLGFKVQET